MSRHPSQARILAVKILRELERRRGFSNRLLADELAQSGLDRRDRGLVTTLVYGVLRHRARLDAMIDRVAHRPAGLRGRAREILRVATLELRELDHPAHAAIPEAIAQIASFDRGHRLAAAAQAILAAIASAGPDLDRALAEGAPLDVLNLRWSIPRWLAGRWIKSLGAERALARGRALAAPPPLDLRVDLGRADADTIAAALAADGRGEPERIPGQPQALRLRGAGDLTEDSRYRSGLLSIQALGAQQPAIALAPRPGERLLDACAGMGTKTLQLAELLGRRGLVVAADSNQARLGQLPGLIARGHLDRPDLDLRVVCGDLRGELPGVDDLAPFDGVLLDAPCTSLGNLARHPELRWTRAYDDIAAAASLQGELLEASWPRVRPGGRLVYAVCSLEPEEGPALVAGFVARHRLRLVEEAAWTPEEHGCDGFYWARIEGGDGSRPEH